ncbi:metalloregulator ArsR/SmtB family transcription factor [Paracoccus sp. MBLB3053]|uniref:Metalloregulator ArsR/SmtB family transcription factor n=1 Tax=Paracoccus aurantius TaxID=3073814 RepID=A0ABU2HYY1_9RHOB|nr:metalloregulator ArsR/SmtB family transcription factor [Paracoccus sp. MBLB3053]MDS9469710.1 metalloregulator ArsR/SmtB family transcription factor [Paracoccus sp. MBLB3053]
MDEPQALAAFAAMSQETRLRVVRLLVQAGPEGMAAGAIGEALGDATTSRLSFHLTHLEHAGLIRSRRNGRFIIYSAVYPALGGLIGFLMKDCCQGHPEICAPALACACDPAATRKA